MGWISLFALATALAMDAFAVAVVAGLALKVLTHRHVFRLSFHFGLFQGLMLFVGWGFGSFIQRYIASADHWIAFAILAAVGARTIWVALRPERPQSTPADPTSGWDLVLLSVATSIDALAVGLSLAVVGSAILAPAFIIAAVACLLTVLGMYIGGRIGPIWGNRIEILGGIILIVIGAKIVYEHTLM
jgi:putative Mn2+ efflux pump MntP